MFDTLRKLAIAVLISAPFISALGHAPSFINRALPVYSEPTRVEVSHDPRGLNISFEITKQYECVIPPADRQDVYAVLSYRTEDGALAKRAANVLKQEHEVPVFKNILILNVPTVLGPYLIEIPSEIYKALEEVSINILCKRPVIGEVYTQIGPFNLAEATVR